MKIIDNNTIKYKLTLTYNYTVQPAVIGDNACGSKYDFDATEFNPDILKANSVEELITNSSELFVRRYSSALGTGDAIFITVQNNNTKRIHINFSNGVEGTSYAETFYTLDAIPKFGLGGLAELIKSTVNEANQAQLSKYLSLQWCLIFDYKVQIGTPVTVTDIIRKGEFCLECTTAKIDRSHLAPMTKSIEQSLIKRVSELDLQVLTKIDSYTDLNIGFNTGAVLDGGQDCHPNIYSYVVKSTGKQPYYSPSYANQRLTTLDDVPYLSPTVANMVSMPANCANAIMRKKPASFILSYAQGAKTSKLDVDNYSRLLQFLGSSEFCETLPTSDYTRIWDTCPCLYDWKNLNANVELLTPKIMINMLSLIGQSTVDSGVAMKLEKIAKRINLNSAPASLVDTMYELAMQCEPKEQEFMMGILSTYNNPQQLKSALGGLILLKK